MSRILLFVLIACCSISKAQNIDVLHYRYLIKLDDKSDTIDVDALIKLRYLRQGLIAIDLAGLQSDGNGMYPAYIQLHSNFRIKTEYSVEKDKINIKPHDLKIGDTIEVSIHCRGVPGDGLIISKNKYGDRTFFADNWPNRAHFWIPCVDRPDDKASFEFAVTAPSHYTVVSNGVKEDEKDLGNGKKFTYWYENIPSSTKVMVIGVAKFATKVYDDSPKDIPVSAWFYPQDSAKGFYDYAITPSILKFFADYIGPFPYKKLANVQSKTAFGGMENASCIFYNEHYVTGRRQYEDVMAHEIAHQWFGDMVSEKSFAHLWLSEGFADYFEHYYFEKKYGEEAARKKWEEAREEVIAFASYSSKPVVDSTEDLMSLLNANSYKKGAWFLRMLRFEVGDSVFQDIIRAFYNQYKGGNAETRDFEAMAEKVSGKELTYFFDQWLYRPGLPQLEMKIRKDNLNTFIVIIQKQTELFLLNTTIGVRNKYDDTHKTISIAITKRETEVKLPDGFNKVYLDPYHKLLFEGKDEFTITNKSR